MSTKFSSTELLNFALKANLVTRSQAEVMHRWAYTDAESLVSQPRALAECLASQRDLERLAQHPQVQAAIVPAQASRASIDQQNQQHAAVARAAIRDGLRISQPQPPQLVQRAYTQQATAYVQPQPDPALKAALKAVQKAAEELPGRLATLIQQAEVQQRRPAKKSKAGQVVWRGAGGSTLTKVTPPSNQLPISPITGQPSTITAAIRRSSGLDGGAALNQHPYQQELARQNQIAQQQANYTNGLPISPITGQPSQITDVIRKSTL